MKILLFLACFFMLSILDAQNCDNIEFIYRDGPGKVKNELNTKKSVYLKDMVVDPALKIKLKLSKDEKLKIFKKLKEMDFWSYPAVYSYEALDKNLSTSSTSPCSSFEMIVMCGGNIKEVKWNDCISGNRSVGQRYEKLEELSRLISKIVYEKKSYKNSKQSKAIYL